MTSRCRPTISSQATAITARSSRLQAIKLSQGRTKFPRSVPLHWTGKADQGVIDGDEICCLPWPHPLTITSADLVQRNSVTRS